MSECMYREVVEACGGSCCERYAIVHNRTATGLQGDAISREYLN